MGIVGRTSTGPIRKELKLQPWPTNFNLQVWINPTIPRSFRYTFGPFRGVPGPFRTVHFRGIWIHRHRIVGTSKSQKLASFLKMF